MITGSQSGSSVSIVTTYEADFDGGYVATFVGTVSAEDQSMSGTWSSNAGQSGTWSATNAMQTLTDYASVVALPNGKALTIGGGGVVFNMAELYDTATNSWT